MKSKNFKGANKKYGFGKGKLYLMKNGENNVVCYSFSIWERIKILFGGKLWFWFVSKNIPGYTLTTTKPFKYIPPKEDNKNGKV